MIFRKYLLYIGIGSLFTLMASCGKEELQNRIIDLEKQQKEDSTLLANLQHQMGLINVVLDSVATFNEAFRTTDEEVQKGEAVSQIRKMDALLSMNFKKLQTFENELDQTLSILKRNPIIRQSIEDKKTEIIGIRDYYVALEKQIESLQEENFNLKEIIKKQEKEMLEKDNIINRIKKEREEQGRLLAQEKKNVTKAKAEAEQYAKDLEETKKLTTEQKANIYFEHAKDLKSMADNDKSFGFGKKKRKSELYQEALKSFEEAQKLGHPKAESAINEFKKVYAKFLK